MADDGAAAPSGLSMAAEPDPPGKTDKAAKPVRSAAVPELPNALAGKYLRVGDKIYRTSADRTPVIRLAPDRIKTGDPDALPDIVRIAKANGWTGIRVSGGDAFKRAAFLAAAAQGLAVENYTPSRKLAAEAERLRTRRARQHGRDGAPVSTGGPDARPDRTEAARLLSERFLRQSDAANARDPDLWRAQSLFAQARAIAATRHARDPERAAREAEAKRQQIAGRIARGETIAPVLRRDGRPVTMPDPSPAPGRDRPGRSR